VTQISPPEERERRKKIATIVVDSIKTIEVECVQFYIETMGVLTQLNEDKVQ
jgi:hypothetical protein